MTSHDLGRPCNDLEEMTKKCESPKGVFINTLVGAGHVNILKVKLFRPPPPRNFSDPSYAHARLMLYAIRPIRTKSQLILQYHLYRSTCFSQKILYKMQSGRVVVVFQWYRTTPQPNSKQVTSPIAVNH